MFEVCEFTMQLYAINTPVVKLGDCLVEVVLRAMKKRGLEFEDGDILVVASKAVSMVEGRFVRLSSIKATGKARRIAEKYGLESRFAELVLREADGVYGGVPKALLTLKDGIFIPNAGVDFKNTPKGYVMLWPKNPNRSAERIRIEIFRRVGRTVGVVVADSHVSPLRLGTSGIAIGLAGFEPVKDLRGCEDIFGYRLSITRHSVADDIACAAHLLMGECAEQTPAVLVRDAPVKIASKTDPSSIKMRAKQCIFGNTMRALK